MKRRNHHLTSLRKALHAIKLAKLALINCFLKWRVTLSEKKYQLAEISALDFMLYTLGVWLPG